MLWVPDTTTTCGSCLRITLILVLVSFSCWFLCFLNPSVDSVVLRGGYHTTARIALRNSLLEPQLAAMQPWLPGNGTRLPRTGDWLPIAHHP